MLHWTRLICDADLDKETLWATVEPPPFDVADFETKFAQKVTAPKPTTQARHSSHTDCYI